MKIAIDGHTLEVENWSGKEQLLFSLLEELAKKNSKDLFILYLRKSVKKTEKLTSAGNLEIRQKNLPTPIWHFWALLDIKRRKIDRLFAPCAYLISALNIFTPSIIMIHDLTAFLKISRSTHKYSLKIREWLFTYLACVRARTIISVSQNTKKDLTKVFKIRNKKIITIYPGHRFPIIKKNGGDDIKPVIISVGTIEPRKNIETIVKSFEILKNNFSEIPWKLIIIGKIGWKSDNIIETIKNSKNFQDIEMKGYVSNEELIKIYQTSLCLIYPSIYEGFGLPPLEAMSLGCPVIVSDNSSLPEVVEDAGLKVNCFDNKKIAEMVNMLWNDIDLRKKLEETGYNQSLKFNWNLASDNILNAIKL